MEKIIGGRKWLLPTGLLLGLSLVFLSGCAAETVNNIAEGVGTQQDGIWVTGTGEMSVTPDVTILSLGIEARTTTVAEAQAQAAVAMDAVMNVLNDYSVAAEDIKTQYYSIQPMRRWDDGKEILLGYQVTNTVGVKIRTMEDTGSIIDAVTAAGGDYTRIGSISFTVDDPSAYEVAVREKAMADAKAKAEQLAELAGVTLGKPTYIAESSSYVPVYYDLMRAAEAASVPETLISPGETEISLSVQVVYSIS